MKKHLFLRQPPKKDPLGSSGSADGEPHMKGGTDADHVQSHTAQNKRVGRGAVATVPLEQSTPALTTQSSLSFAGRKQSSKRPAAAEPKPKAKRRKTPKVSGIGSDQLQLTGFFSKQTTTAVTALQGSRIISTKLTEAGSEPLQLQESRLDEDDEEDDDECPKHHRRMRKGKPSSTRRRRVPTSDEDEVDDTDDRIVRHVRRNSRKLSIGHESSVDDASDESGVEWARQYLREQGEHSKADELETAGPSPTPGMDNQDPVQEGNPPPRVSRFGQTRALEVAVAKEKRPSISLDYSDPGMFEALQADSTQAGSQTILQNRLDTFETNMRFIIGQRKAHANLKPVNGHYSIDYKLCRALRRRTEEQIWTLVERTSLPDKRNVLAQLASDADFTMLPAITSCEMQGLGIYGIYCVSSEGHHVYVGKGSSEINWLGSRLACYERCKRHTNAGRLMNSNEAKFASTRMLGNADTVAHIRVLASATQDDLCTQEELAVLEALYVDYMRSFIDDQESAARSPNCWSLYQEACPDSRKAVPWEGLNSCHPWYQGFREDGDEYLIDEFRKQSWKCHACDRTFVEKDVMAQAGHFPRSNVFSPDKVGGKAICSNCAKRYARLINRADHDEDTIIDECREFGAQGHTRYGTSLRGPTKDDRIDELAWQACGVCGEVRENWHKEAKLNRGKASSRKINTGVCLKKVKNLKPYHSKVTKKTHGYPLQAGDMICEKCLAAWKKALEAELPETPEFCAKWIEWRGIICADNSSNEHLAYIRKGPSGNQTRKFQADTCKSWVNKLNILLPLVKAGEWRKAADLRGHSAGIRH